MPEPLKNLYTRELIDSLSQEISGFYQEFDVDGFTKQVFGDYAPRSLRDRWQSKELKERMRHISQSLHHFLPSEYAEAIAILINAGSQFNGFEYMFFPGFVELYGLEEYQESIAALEHFTKYSSSEFAVRPFIKKYQGKMIRQMEIWAESDNHHVRRLASEGCRPRLPWAMALPDFKQDPSPILPILSKLKNDHSEYVRRSVANNLNDISKDNPQTVIEIAHNWLGDTPQVDWVVKHGCRTLLKKGEQSIMTLFGFFRPEHLKIYDFQMPKSVAIGGELSFSFILKTQRSQLGKLRIEYGIDFVRKNGRRSRKVFKVSEAEVTGQEKLVKKSHSFRKISTRNYYAGCHGIAIIVNGYELASKEFMLS